MTTIETLLAEALDQTMPGATVAEDAAAIAIWRCKCGRTSDEPSV